MHSGNWPRYRRQFIVVERGTPDGSYAADLSERGAACRRYGNAAALSSGREHLNNSAVYKRTYNDARARAYTKIMAATYRGDLRETREDRESEKQRRE